MEILGKIITGLLFLIVVIFISAGVIFLFISIEMKLLFHKSKRLRENISKEEQRLLELSKLVHSFSETVAEHIGVLTERRKELSDKTQHCTCSESNNTDNQT